MKRYFCISDIHGYLNAFNDVLEQANFKLGEDVLYILGDMIDWGEQSIETILKIKEWQEQYPETIFVTPGNHELMLVSSQNNYRSKTEWFKNNGYDTLISFRELDKNTQEDLINWIKELKPFYEIDNYYLTHSSPIKENDKISCNVKKMHDDLPLDIASAVWKRVNHNKKSFENKVLVSGHTPNYLNMCDGVYFDLDNNFIGIDCGAKTLCCDALKSTKYSSKLALLELYTHNVWYSTKL